MRIYAASAIGKGHIDHNIPCQDAHAFTSKNGLLAAAVCDGAGSASSSDLGAKECAATICNFLIEHLDGRPLECDQALFEQGLIGARNRLEVIAAEHSLHTRDLACTLVGAILNEQGGYLFHIGDGMAVVELEDDTFITSLPENGEYSNETYFVTGSDWQAHLRVQAFSGTPRCLVLMSDGAMSFAAKGGKLFAPFIDPVKAYLVTVPETEGSAELHDTLADERTWKITSDDKTILVALHD
jgi:hypothetical protein